MTEKKYDMADVKRTRREPKVGIFWFYKRTLLTASAPLDKGVETSDSVNGPFDHIDFWPILQRQHPKLRQLEYEDVPRGRVLFLKATRTFDIYMDKRLHTPTFKRQLLAAFDLPKSRTRYRTDPHYTTDPKDLELLFGSDG
jgi:hypothetical protein